MGSTVLGNMDYGVAYEDRDDATMRRRRRSASFRIFDTLILSSSKESQIYIDGTCHIRQAIYIAQEPHWSLSSSR